MKPVSQNIGDVVYWLILLMFLPAILGTLQLEGLLVPVQGMVDKIVRLSGVGPGDHVVEIGPGLGSLTEGLCVTGAEVVAVEIDQYLLPALRERVGSYEEQGRLTIVNRDAREVEWPSILGPHRWSVVANLPYNIATPLILDLLASQPQLGRWLVMVQRPS